MHGQCMRELRGVAALAQRARFRDPQHSGDCCGRRPGRRKHAPDIGRSHPRRNQHCFRSSTHSEGTDQHQVGGGAGGSVPHGQRLRRRRARAILWCGGLGGVGPRPGCAVAVRPQQRRHGRAVARTVRPLAAAALLRHLHHGLRCQLQPVCPARHNYSTSVSAAHRSTADTNQQTPALHRSIRFRRDARGCAAPTARAAHRSRATSGD